MNKPECELKNHITTPTHGHVARMQVPHAPVAYRNALEHPVRQGSSALDAADDWLGSTHGAFRKRSLGSRPVNQLGVRDMAVVGCSTASCRWCFGAVGEGHSPMMCATAKLSSDKYQIARIATCFGRALRPTTKLNMVLSFSIGSQCWNLQSILARIDR